MTIVDAIPLSDIEWVKIYFNTKKRKSTMDNLKRMLTETGGDFMMNSAIFLRSLKPCCHLKADGSVKCKPNYTAWGISWNNADDFTVERMPSTKSNYMECVHVILSGKKIDPVRCNADMMYKTHRTAVGTKDGKFAYYVTNKNYSPEQLRDVLFSLGWDNAIMMDGGGSTCFMDNGGKGFTGDGRVIPFFLVVKMKRKTNDDSTYCPYKEPTTTIRRGSSGTGACWVQWHLNRHGANLIVDGDFGSKSVDALLKFQKSAFTSKDDWDGLCGKATREKLKL